MAALYVRSQELAKRAILQLCGVPKTSCHRDLNAEIAGGIEQAKPGDPDRP